MLLKNLNPASGASGNITHFFVIVTMMMFALGVAAMAALTSNATIAFQSIYVGVFLVAAWKYPHLATGAIIVSSPYILDLSGGVGAKFSIAEVHILLVTVVVIAKSFVSRRFPSLGKMTGPVLLYMGISTVTAVQGGVDTVDITALVQLAIFCLITPMLFVSQSTSHRVRNNMMIATGCVCVVLAIFQIISGPASKVFALGMHKNNMGQSLAAGLTIWLATLVDGQSGWWKKFTIPALIIVAVGLMFTLSRGAWVGAVIAVIVLLLAYQRFRLVWQVSAIVIPVIALMWTLAPQQDKDYATGFDAAKYDNIKARYSNSEQALNTFSANPLFGAGISVRKTTDATNLVLTTLAEGGAFGFVAMFIMFAAYIKLFLYVRRYVPPSDPRFMIVAMSAALMIGRLAHGQFDHYWVRGASTVAWASVGMLISIAIEVRQSTGKPRSQSLARGLRGIQPTRLLR